MSWFGVFTAVAAGNAAAPLVRLLLFLLGLVVLAGLWGVATGAGQ